MAPVLTDGLSPASLAQFRVLQLSFVTGLTERWREIAGATTQPERQAALHRLAGAAGSYGFDGISACARSAELLSPDAADSALAQALALVEAEIALVQTHSQVNSLLKEM